MFNIKIRANPPPLPKKKSPTSFTSVCMIFVYFGLFLLSGINDGGTANLSDLASLSVKGPAADFVSEHVFNEKHSPVKAQPQFIKQLNVLQQVVIRVTGGVMWVFRIVMHQNLTSYMRCFSHSGHVNVSYSWS